MGGGPSYREGDRKGEGVMGGGMTEWSIGSIGENEQKQENITLISRGALRLIRSPL
jgi:hypothetical protein